MSGRERLRPIEHLRRKSDFERVYKDGRRYALPFLVAYVLGGDENRSVRVGVVASRRIGGAVQRNRAKRILRELFRRNRPGGARGADLVLIARASLLKGTYRDFQDAYVRTVCRALERSGQNH